MASLVILAKQTLVREAQNEVETSSFGVMKRDRVRGGEQGQLGMVCEGSSSIAAALTGWSTTGQCWARKPKFLRMCQALGLGGISAEVKATLPNAWWACEGQVLNVYCEFYCVNLVTELLEVGQRLWEAVCCEETSLQCFPPACQSLWLCCTALGVLSASFWASRTLAREEAPWLQLLVLAATHQHWFSTPQDWRWRHSLLLMGWDPLVAPSRRHWEERDFPPTFPQVGPTPRPWRSGAGALGRTMDTHPKDHIYSCYSWLHSRLSPPGAAFQGGDLGWTKAPSQLLPPGDTAWGHCGDAPWEGGEAPSVPWHSHGYCDHHLGEICEVIKKFLGKKMKYPYYLHKHLVYVRLHKHRGMKVIWTAMLRASSSGPETRWSPEGTTSSRLVLRSPCLMLYCKSPSLPCMHPMERGQNALAANTAILQ